MQIVISLNEEMSELHHDSPVLTPAAVAEYLQGIADHLLEFSVESMNANGGLRTGSTHLVAELELDGQTQTGRTIGFWRVEESTGE